ncbi:hypothetical protein ACO0OE_003994 [Hanseniaspora uvarum]
MIDHVNLIFQLQALLGRERWIKYASVLSQFIVGKISLNEMHEELTENVLWKTDILKINDVLFKDMKKFTDSNKKKNMKAKKSYINKKLKLLEQVKSLKEKKLYINKKIILIHNRLIIAMLGNIAEEILVQGKPVIPESTLDNKSSTVQSSLDVTKLETNDESLDSSIKASVETTEEKDMEENTLTGIFTIDNDALDELEQQQKIMRANKSKSSGFDGLSAEEQKNLMNHKNSNLIFLNKILNTFPPEDKLRFSRIQKESGKRGFINSTVLKDKLNSLLKVPTGKEFIAVNINGHIPGRYLTDPQLARNNSIQALYNITKQQQYENYIRMMNPSLSINKLFDNKYMNSYLEENGLLEYNQKFKNNNNSHLKLTDVHFPLDGFLGTNQFSRDITKGYEQPLCKELNDLPDIDNLNHRLVGEIRQLGMIGNVAPGCSEMLLLGLQQYLCDIVEEVHDVIKYKKKKFSELYELNEKGEYEKVDIFNTKENFQIETISQDQEQEFYSITCEDVMDALNVNPSLIHQSVMPKDFIMREFIFNDDELIKPKSAIDDLHIFESEENRPVMGTLAANQQGTQEELMWILRDTLMD